MIITCQKEIEEILKCVGNGPVFLIGCNECATMCHTGGQEEILAMKKIFEERNIRVTGWVILEPACHLNNDRRLFKDHLDEIVKAKNVLVLACGNGVQTVSELITDIDVIPGLDSLFLGEIKRANEFEKRCVMCGSCIQQDFGNICPVSRCPKEMLNGPCGGSNNGKCEVNSEIECVWNSIYERLKEKKKQDKLRNIVKPKDWSKSIVMRRKI